MRFSQVRMLVDDFASAFRFYRDELGLQPSFGDETTGYASFAAGDGTVAIFERAEQGQVVELRQAGDAALLVLEVDDVDADVERLRPRVVRDPVDQPGWGGRVAYLRDPAGHLIELFQELRPAE